MVHALFERLDVPVEHRHVGAQPETMRDAVDVEIPIGPALVVTDLAATRSAKISGASTRQ
jgi:hypothetical protein